MEIEAQSSLGLEIFVPHFQGNIGGIVAGSLNKVTLIRNFTLYLHTTMENGKTHYVYGHVH